MPHAIFDCTSQETKIVTTVPGMTDFCRHARTLRTQLIEQRKAAGMARPHIVPVVLRKNPSDMRWFNLNHRNSSEVYAEALLGPTFRIATAEEEKAEIARLKVEAKRQASAALSYAEQAARTLASKASFQRAVDLVNSGEPTVAPTPDLPPPTATPPEELVETPKPSKPPKK